MNPEELETRVRQAVAADSWSEFEGIIAPVELRLIEEEPEGAEANADALIRVDNRLSTELLEDAGFAVAVITDLFSKLLTLGALRLGTSHLEELEGSPWPRPSLQEARIRLWQSAVAGIARQLSHGRVAFADPGSDALRRALENSEPAPIPGQSTGWFSESSNVTMPAGTFQLITSATGLSSGDVVFREMHVPFVKILRTFGHAGVYVGTSKSHPTSGQHVVVEMQMDRRGGECRIVTLNEFRKAGGVNGYWGGYSADLKPSERYLVVATALSYVGVAKYGFINHKDPNAAKFRCDGLAEHCYESIQPLPQRLQHRGGLFEDDRWNTMSPASLRNCMFTKVP